MRAQRSTALTELLPTATARAFGLAFVFLVSFSQSVAAAPAKTEAVVAAQQKMESIFVRCGQKTYAEFSRHDALNRLRKYFVEYTKFEVKVGVLPVSEADKLNGVEWRSTFIVSPSIYRDRLDDLVWSDYKTNGGFLNYEIVLTKKRGDISEFVMSDDGYVAHPSCAEILEAANGTDHSR